MSLEDFNRALEMDAARAFDKDNIAGLKILASHRPAASASGRKIAATPAGAGRSGEVLRIAAHAHHDVEPGFGGGLAAGRVKRGACSPSSSISPATRMRRLAGRAASVRIMERSASGLEL